MVVDRRVTEIMTKRVFTVETSSWVIDAARIMVENDITGLPVLEDGELVGMINEMDLVSREIQVSDPTYLSIFSAMITLPWDKTPDEFRRVTAATVGDLMSEPCFSVRARATVRDIATLMFEQKLNPVPVLDDDDQIVGIVSRSDIVRLIVEDADEAALADES